MFIVVSSVAAGLVSGTLTTIALQPLDLIKTRTQTTHRCVYARSGYRPSLLPSSSTVSGQQSGVAMTTTNPIALVSPERVPK